MKKLFFGAMLACAAFVAVSINAQEPCEPVCTDPQPENCQPAPCNPQPCDTTVCTPAPCNPGC